MRKSGNELIGTAYALVCYVLLSMVIWPCLVPGGEMSNDAFSFWNILFLIFWSLIGIALIIGLIRNIIKINKTN